MGQFVHGWLRSPPDNRDSIFAAPIPLEGLPPQIDLSGKLTPSNNQGNLGSCGPHAVDQLINYNQANQNLPYLETSKLFTYYNARKIMGTVNQDSGVENRAMLQSLKLNGFCVPEALWPYDVQKYRQEPPPPAYAAAKKVISYATVSQTLDQMRATLASGFPFLFGFSVFPAMDTPAVARSGDLPMPAGQSVGGHDVAIVGYDNTSRRFKFQNSWGVQWGARGYGTIPYEYASNPSWAGDFWVITQIEGVPTPPEPIPPQPIPPTPTGSRLIVPPGGLAAGEYTLTKV